MHALYQCLPPAHPIRLVTTVVPFCRQETEAGKGKHVACTQDLHPDQPGSEASALAYLLSSRGNQGLLIENMSLGPVRHFI